MVKKKPETIKFLAWSRKAHQGMYKESKDTVKGRPIQLSIINICDKQP